MWIRLKDVEEATKVAGVLEAAGLTVLANEIRAAADDIGTLNHRQLIMAARDQYAIGSDDDVEVDSDAATSEADEHTWVMMWGCVRHDNYHLPHGKTEDGVDLYYHDVDEDDMETCKSCGTSKFKEKSNDRFGRKLFECHCGYRFAIEEEEP